MTTTYMNRYLLVNGILNVNFLIDGNSFDDANFIKAKIELINGETLEIPVDISSEDLDELTTSKAWSKKEFLDWIMVRAL
jgi:hypothetical protein